MTQPERSDSPRRRWRSQQDAYDDGRMVGFMAACELLAVINDPEGFARRLREAAGGLAAAIDAAMGEQ